MAKLMSVALLLFVVVTATRIMADEEADSLPENPTEEQVQQTVFNVQKAMVENVHEAVRVINDVFGNPDCQEATESKRDTSEQVDKRKIKWGNVLKGALKGAVGALLVGKRSAGENDQSQEVNKRRWGVGFSVGKRAAEAIQQQKRGWVNVHFYGDKRSAQINQEQKRRWGFGVSVGKRLAETNQQQKRRWGFGVSVGKRLAEANQQQKRGWGHVYVYGGKRSANGGSEAAPAEESPADNAEFVADVTQLKHAVEVLSTVVAIAESTLEEQ